MNFLLEPFITVFRINFLSRAIFNQIKKQLTVAEERGPYAG